ncbi:HD domain-containing protein [Fundidesulfovibrio putealis]|uniref:HD domain-containing protein n=1 Tax=Fundidesulfovibrio putealis TaxID=270496 RepID=UPI000414664C|nr:HD domain-containing protein [Fundidesulfovibrio putealis]
MSQSFKDAVGICKAIIRNGYDAYVINARLQKALLAGSNQPELDVCTDAGLDELQKLFPNVSQERGESFARLKEGETLINFYHADAADASHPEECLVRLTSRLAKRLTETEELPPNLACPYLPRTEDPLDGFADFSGGVIRFKGIQDQTLRQDYLRAIRAMRYAANFGLPIGPNSWMAILRAGQRVLDYVPVSDIMDEWRKVEAENMHVFVRLLYESMILHGLLPEIAALARIKQKKNDTEDESVFEHTLNVMKHYPDELPYDWFGTLSCLFHDVGKLHTAEIVDGQWNFHQHHRVGAKVARRLLSSLRMPHDEIDLICHLVRHHMRFHFMLTDKGIRRFKALDEYPRLIEHARADIKARGGTYKEFNHNMKMLDRTEIREEELEPLLNGKEIMTILAIPPGPAVGVIRDALLQAQVMGDVQTVEQAVDFVKKYSAREQLNG